MAAPAAETLIMLAVASMSVGALVSYFKNLFIKTTKLKIGDVEISVKGPDAAANEIVQDIKQRASSARTIR